MTEKNKQHQPLSRENVIEIAGALHSIREIETRTIKLPDDEATLNATRDWLAAKLYVNASELIGSWFAAHDEYQPLIEIYAKLQIRAAAVNRQYFSEANPPTTLTNSGEASDKGKIVT
jgi:hypothetical protein